MRPPAVVAMVAKARSVREDVPPERAEAGLGGITEVAPAIEAARDECPHLA